MTIMTKFKKDGFIRSGVLGVRNAARNAMETVDTLQAAWETLRDCWVWDVTKLDELRELRPEQAVLIRADVLCQIFDGKFRG